MVKVKMISRDDLIKIFEEKRGHSFISVQTETIPVLNKRGRISGLSIEEKFGCLPSEIIKVSQFTCMIGLDYSHVIKSRLEKEGKTIDEYIKGESWHEAVPGTRNLRRHKKTKELFVYLFMLANNKPISAYYANGVMIDKEKIGEFLPIKSIPTNQGLSSGNEVIVRTFKLSSIRRIKMDNEEFIVR